jgi:hypothetical protein
VQWWRENILWHLHQGPLLCFFLLIFFHFAINNTICHYQVTITSLLVKYLPTKQESTWT